MTWTKDKPTTQGWYWYRGEIDAVHDEDVVVIYVKDGRGWQPFMDYDAPLDEFTGEWAGPIAPPRAAAA